MNRRELEWELQYQSLKLDYEWIGAKGAVSLTDMTDEALDRALALCRKHRKYKCSAYLAEEKRYRNV